MLTSPTTHIYSLLTASWYFASHRAKAAQQMQAGGQRPNMQQVQAMQKAMPPELLRQMRSAGSPAAAQKVMQEYIGKHGEEGINMQAMLGAMMPGMGGGGGGMPGMPGKFIEVGLPRIFSYSPCDPILQTWVR